MRHFKRFLISTLSFVSVGCSTFCVHDSISSDDLLIKDNFTLRSPETLSLAQQKQDIDLLIYAIQNAYGGRNHIPVETLNASIDSLNMIRSSNVVLTVSGLCTQIAKSLSKIPDNHLTIRMNGNKCLSTESTKTTGVGKNTNTNLNKAWRISDMKIKNSRIPVISITSMPSSEDQVWDGFLKKIENIKITASAIVIDLRGNGGGDDTMGVMMANYMYGQNAPTPWKAIIKSNTPETWAIAVNSPKLKILRLKQSQKHIPEYLTKKLEQKTKKYEMSKEENSPRELINQVDQGNPFNHKKAFTHPIYILIDRECASSCESIIEAFESHPFAITVGENTAGFIHFGNVGQLVLKNSQMNIQMATDFWQRTDGKVYEKIGYTPKIKLNSGVDALEFTKNNCLLKKSNKCQF